MPNIPNKVAPAELIVLRAVWRLGQATSSQVVAALAGEADWKPKTVHTLLKRLVQKGALAQAKVGREYQFTPLVREEEYAIEASRSFLGRFFDGELAPFLSCFLKHEKLSRKELSELKKLLDDAKP